MLPQEFQHLPVNADDHGEFVVWDIRDWEGDAETMDEINQAWVAVHEPEQYVGTISVFPEDIIIHGDIEEIISGGWNEAARATGLQHLAIVGEGLQTIAVQSHIDAPTIETMDGFDEIDEAVSWMESQVS
jgi:hypothetical protein